MSRPTTRVLAMLELLQDRQHVPGAELADRLEVDPRTVRRYAMKLQELGIPVEAERGRYGGYRLRPGYKLPPLMLNDDEATAVVLGLVSARQFGLTTAAPAVDTALTKIGRVLPRALGDQARALADTLGFTAGGRERPTPATETVLKLAQAAREQRRVGVRYRSWSGEESERDLDPYGLVFHAGRWYMAAHDHKSGEVRTFRVDRVLEAELGAAAEPVPEGFDAVEHVTRSLALGPWEHEVEVVLDTTLEQARRRIGAAYGEVSAEPGGGVLLRTRTNSLTTMARVLVWLGFPFTVRTPEALREELRELAAELERVAARAG